MFFQTDVNTVDKIVLAACALHNWLIEEKRYTYIMNSASTGKISRQELLLLVLGEQKL